jgi:hypothetical protein
VTNEDRCIAEYRYRAFSPEVREALLNGGTFLRPELDWCNDLTLESTSGSWRSIDLDDEWRISEPLGPRIGLLQHAWCGESAIMEHWVQWTQQEPAVAGELYCRRIAGAPRVFETLEACLQGEGGMSVEEARRQTKAKGLVSYVPYTIVIASAGEDAGYSWQEKNEEVQKFWDENDLDTLLEEFPPYVVEHLRHLVFAPSVFLPTSE